LIDKITIETKEEINTKEFFNQLIQLANENSFSLAIWRYPNTNTFSAVFSFESSTERKLDLQTNVGFALAPFFSSECNAHFIHADIVIHEKENGLDIIGSSECRNRLVNLLKNKAKPKLKDTVAEDLVVVSKNNFITCLNDAIEAINDGKFKKVVIGRRKKIELSESFQIVNSLYEMSNTYPFAFISYVSCHKLGKWIGATPEVLLSIKDKRHFKTVSLAGTQLAKAEQTKNAVWTQKEIEEQALVTRYIIDCFKKIRLREYEDIGPRTIKAGNLFHLCTDFFVDMEEVNFPDLGNVMLELLHPTSAVCGMPKHASEEFIKKYEGFDRELYSGYLGPINIDNNTHLAVNLRCAKLQQNTATLFAGVGITADSEPEKEWLETEMKFETIRKALT